MDIFEKTKEHELAFADFADKVDRICEQLAPYEENIDLADLKAVKKNFLAKTDDFFREDRKLNIGVIGRVKAGKSTFLNSLLFDGEPVLPMAATPKTAALTKIEYDDENSIQIEYYTKEEWEIIRNNAKVQSDLAEFSLAREIIQMVKDRGLNADDYVGTVSERKVFADNGELNKELNEYVGENGKYTPLVKSVSVTIDREELEDISIVDTPGLNDPIVSRTDKTRQFMELCDVVFFLSKSTGFLDTDDVDLLVSQLPQKGVKRMVLVCTRMDDGLRDIMWEKDSVKTAYADMKKKLVSYTDETLENYKKTHYFMHSNVIDQCKEPVFVSVHAYNMSKKTPMQYSPKEQKLFEDLNRHGEINAEFLKELGNMDQIKAIYQDVIAHKDDMLLEKANSFVPNAEEELKTQLIRLQKLAEKRSSQLKRFDREEIVEQKNQYTEQVNKINMKLEEIFGEWCMKVENNKTQALRDLRGYYRDYLQLNEKEGSTTHFETSKVSNAKWFMPWTWGSTVREVYSYDEKYKYIDASDAIENIRNFANDAATCIEDTFNRSFDIAATKRQLLNTVIENFDVADENFTPSYYKLLVEKTLNSIEMPMIKIDVSNFVSGVAAQFFGEVRDNAKRTDLKNTLSTVIGELFDQICNIFESEVGSFKAKVEEMKQTFSNELLHDIIDELNIVLEKYENKEKEIEDYNRFVTAVERVFPEI
ncbi:MAG: dynamin family protein [Clostridiales bacterium]|nr:dynamin family protein [Clostridiales bacterium]